MSARGRGIRALMYSGDAAAGEGWGGCLEAGGGTCVQGKAAGGGASWRRRNAQGPDACNGIGPLSRERGLVLVFGSTRSGLGDRHEELGVGLVLLEPAKEQLDRLLLLESG